MNYEMCFIGTSVKIENEKQQQTQVREQKRAHKKPHFMHQTTHHVRHMGVCARRLLAFANSFESNSWLSKRLISM